jgi:hypothetical protein
MNSKLKFMILSLALGAGTVLARAQELVGDDPDKPAKVAAKAASVPDKGFFDQLILSYSTWDLFKVGWLAATVIFAYGIATIFFRAMLGDRSATTAAKLGCFLGALAFIGINLVTFGLLIFEMHDYNWLGWASALVLLVIVVVMLNAGRKVRA